MKRFLKGVVRFVKNSAEKVIDSVDSLLFDQHKLLVMGIILTGVGVSMVVAAKTAF